MRSKAPLFLFASVLALAGCGKGNFSKSANEGKENVFRYTLVQKPTTLDPGMVQDGNTIDVIQQVFEGLTAWSEDNKVVPNLAESWDISPDGKVYTFHIRKGVKFDSGRELKADDFKYSIERAADPALKSVTVMDYLDDIVGIKDFNAGKAKEISGLKVVDDYTLQVTIDQARPYFLGKLTYPNSYVVDKDIAKKGVEITTVEAMKCGTGPYTPESYKSEQVFVLAANKNYHGGAPKVDKIERPIIIDSSTRIAKFRSGEVDLIQLPRQDIPGVQNIPELKGQLKFYDRPAIWYVGFNSQLVPALKDPRVRRALGMAINRKRIVDDVLGGFNQIANCILPPGVDGARKDLPGIPFDVAGAKKLLQEAGVEGKIPPLDMFYRSEEADYGRVVEAVQGDLKQNLGITVNAKPLQSTAYFDRYNKKQLPTYQMRWAADYLDPQDFISLFFATTGAENKFNYSNPEVDKLCAAADVEKDHDKRMALYAKAEDIVLNEVVWVPIFFQKDAELVSPRVHGMRESAFGHLPHTTVSMSN